MSVHFPFQLRSARQAAALAIICVAAVAILRHDGVANATARVTEGLANPELQRAAQRIELCSSANVVGVGLRGEYFAEGGLRGVPLLVRIDSSIDFDASLDWPTDRSSHRPQSVRWTGWVKAPTTGRYRFHVEPKSARVQVARQTVAGADAAPVVALDLVAGRFYPVSVEMSAVDSAKTSRVRLEWTAPHGARFVVPRALLNLPTDTASNARL